jgi:hypothetical protein
MVNGFADGVGGHAYAKFLRFDLFRATDLHDSLQCGGQSHLGQFCRDLLELL